MSQATLSSPGKLELKTVHFGWTKMKQKHLSLVYTSWDRWVGGDIGTIRGLGRWMEDSKYYASLRVSWRKYHDGGEDLNENASLRVDDGSKVSF